jgi:hypothetical protein
LYRYTLVDATTTKQQAPMISIEVELLLDFGGLITILLAISSLEVGSDDMEGANDGEELGTDDGFLVGEVVGKFVGDCNDMKYV